MNIGIVGLGLIGASFGKTLKKNGGHKVFGYDIDSNVNLKAVLVGAIDEVIDETNVKSLDVLIIALYPRLFTKTFYKYADLLKDGALVMDFSGVKRIVVSEMQTLAKKYPKLKFASCHTMAGREFSGIDKSLSTLFEKASCVVTGINTDIFELDQIKNFFLSLGFGEVVYSTADNHDKNIAYTSQLCHIVSNAFIKSPTAKNHFGYSAGSYKDLTRVAKLNSTMWSELMQDNRDYLKEELKTLIDNLQKYYVALDTGNEEELKNLLEEGNLLKISIDKGKVK